MYKTRSVGSTNIFTHSLSDKWPDVPITPCLFVSEKIYKNNYIINGTTFL